MFSAFSERFKNRSLTRIYLEPTSLCNLNCRTCIRNSWSEKPGEMPFETYQVLLRGMERIPTLKKISFWGFGEPLLHPDILEMIRSAKKLKVKTELITDGLLLSERISAGLIAAGLDSLVVSLDGTSPETQAGIRGGANLAEIQNNIQLLNSIRKAKSKRNPEVGIEFVVMRRNLSELKNLVPMAKRMEAGLVIVTNVLPYSEELQKEILYWMSATGYSPAKSYGRNPKILLPRIDRFPEILPHLQKITSAVRADAYPPEWSMKSEGYCPFIGDGSLAIASDGSVSPCIALMHSYRCFILGRQKSIRRYVVGDVQNDDLLKVWINPEFRQFRERVRKFHFSPCTSCGGCDLSESNEGDCIGSPFPACGDCLWAKGVILCP